MLLICFRLFQELTRISFHLLSYLFLRHLVLSNPSTRLFFFTLDGAAKLFQSKTVLAVVRLSSAPLSSMKHESLTSRNPLRSFASLPLATGVYPLHELIRTRESPICRQTQGHTGKSLIRVYHFPSAFQKKDVHHQLTCTSLPQTRPTTNQDVWTQKTTVYALDQIRNLARRK